MATRLALCCSLLWGCAPQITFDSGSVGPQTGTDTGTGGAGQTTAVVVSVSSDYATGTMSTISLDDWSIDDGLFVASGDPGVAVDDGWVFQINRYGYDNLRLYTPGAWTEPVWEQELGDLSNPYDAHVCADALFVSLYGRDHLGVYDIASGTLVDTVSLAAFADGDEVGPEPGGMVEVGDKLYVGLNRLNRDDSWASVGAKVVEIDCATASVGQSWDVAGNASVKEWAGTDKLLAVAQPFEDQPGGVYAIDPGLGTVEHLVEVQGEAINGVAAWGDMAIATTVTDDQDAYGVRCVDLVAGTTSLLTQGPQYFNGVRANDRGEAWVSAGPSWLDTDADTGLYVYDIEACEALTDGPLQLELHPNGLAFY